jgi:hypothetical protein
MHRNTQIALNGLVTGLPNTRLKLAAPFLNRSGGNADVQCGRILFVKLTAWRRSLSAIR